MRLVPTTAPRSPAESEVSIKILAVVAKAPRGDRNGPKLRVQCSLCRQVYLVNGWPRMVVKRNGCRACIGKECAARYWAAMRRPGVWGMRCEG